jgi:eukaryotic-like serine/threonine-protein kinase
VIGKTLGYYEIESLLGAGGMGEVYRARDTKLGRSVAVKVLPEAFANDSDRLPRFEREAKVLASLNHPNIAALYGMEESGGIHFLAMELVEGETLSERLRRGPVPVEEAMKIAHQIAEALEAAHEKGIVHRDLKPANVKVTPEDRVKVLDFGLAKAMSVANASAIARSHQGMEDAPANATLSNSPTLSLAATSVGVILGTAAYMSPEQAKGFSADARSDVFSFGCVLYEMLTGRQLFQGETIAEILGAVLVSSPDLGSLPGDLNPRITELLRRCLEKKPKRRWQSVGDLRFELETLAAAPRQSTIVAAQMHTRESFWRRALPILAGMLVVAAVAGMAAWILKPARPGTVKRFALTLPEDQAFTRQGSRIIALSPDGERLVYTANGQMFLRSMSEMEARPISGGNNAAPAVPVFSPDGQWVAFQSQFALKKIAISGGTPVTLCDWSGNPGGASWDGDHLVFGVLGKGILRVSENGGEPETIVAAKPNETMSDPQLLNGGRDILFSVTTETAGVDRWDRAQVVVQSLKSGKRKVIWPGGSAAAYLPSGHLVFAVGSTLMAIPFDPEKLELHGGPVPVLEGVARGQIGGAQFAFSKDGTSIYVPGGLATSATADRTLALVDRHGTVQRLGLPPRPYYHPRFSPDGKKLVVGTDDGNDAVIWVLDDLKGGSPLRRLTFGGKNSFPIWTPDGHYITFASDREGGRALFRQPVEGGTAELLAKIQAFEVRSESWHPNGKTLSFLQTQDQGGDIWLLPMDGDRKPQPLVKTVENERYSTFSPDGRWFAYITGRASGGGFQVFVQPFPPTGAQFQITTDGGTNPVWSHDGKQLFYNTVAGTTQQTAPGKLVAVDIRTQPSFTFGNPVQIPITGAILGGTGTNYDISPDDKQFVVVQSSSSSSDPTRRITLQINVILNWFTDLQRRAPVK